MHVYLSLKLTIKGIVQQFSPLQKYDQDFFSRVIDNLQLINPQKSFIFWFDSDKFLFKKILLLYIKNNFVYCKTHIDIYA